MPNTEKPSEESVENKVDSEVSVPDNDLGQEAEGRASSEESVHSKSADDESNDEGDSLSSHDNEPPEKTTEVEETSSSVSAQSAKSPKQNFGIPFFVGGAVAVACGFFLSQALPDGWPRPPDQTLQNIVNAQSTTIEEQASRLSEVQSRFENLQARVDELEAQELPAFSSPAELEAVEAQLSAAQDSIVARMTELEAALDALESVPLAPDPTGLTEDDVAAFRDELAAVVAGARAELDEARAAAEAVEAETAKAAMREAAFEALTRLRTSVDLGLGYDQALLNLTDAAPVKPAAALTASAGDGVATMLELQSEFPELARTAIAASAEAPASDAGAMQRLGQFLRTQTNARSLAPREGTDADAVLSRAQAALETNDLGAALAELSTLPANAAEVFEEWIARASNRSEALQGLDDLAAQISAM